MAKKAYKNVLELSESVLGKKFTGELKAEIDYHSLSGVLQKIRCMEGLSQEEMAERMGCSQSKISKIENASNDRISVEELTRFTEVMELNVELRIQKPMKTVDRIKQRVFEIKRDLDLLAELGGKDEDVAHGVDGFFGELFFNAVTQWFDSHEKLTKARKKKVEPGFQIVPPFSKEEVNQTTQATSAL